MKNWIYNITKPPNDWVAGDSGDFWTEPRYYENDDIIWRIDGGAAGEPRWNIGDRTLGFDPVSQRFFATMTVLTEATWKGGTDCAYHFQMRVDKVNYYGPFVADTLMKITQGARKKIDPCDFDTIDQKMDTKWPGTPAGVDRAAV
jgi:hypothetical protein